MWFDGTKSFYSLLSFFVSNTVKWSTQVIEKAIAFFLFLRQTDLDWQYKESFVIDEPSPD